MTELCFENKYKDRNPQQTVELIKNYFISLGYEPKLIMCQESNVNTWTARVELFYKDIILLGANGKGLTKEYCLASGYAELYERFCNKMYCTNNYPLGNRVIEKSFEINKYYFDKDEQFIDFNQAFSSSVIGRSFLDNFNDIQDIIKKYFHTILNNKFIGVPYKNCHGEDIIYMDQRIVTFLSGSSGMSAGNTFYEAYIQAMSELYEHYIAGSYYTKEQNVYYAIDLNNITNPSIKKIITQIQKDNDLYIIDFSYNFNVPVLMALTVNHTTHSITVNLGSSPIFDIALERVLTELYQGRLEGFNKYKDFSQYPSKLDINPKVKDLIYKGSQTYMISFPEFIITKLKIIPYFNDKIFLNKNCSNKELYEYLKYINDLNGFKPYYYDVSGCKDIYAIKVFDINMPYLEIQFDGLREYVGENEFKLAINYYNVINRYLNTNGQLNYLNYNITCEDILQISHDRMDFFLFTLFCTYLNWENCYTYKTDDLSFLSYMIVHNPKELFMTKNTILKKFAAGTHLYKELNKFTILYRYIMSDYSSDEIMSILSFLGIEYTIEDITNLNNSEYLIRKIIFADLNKYLEGYYDDLIILLSNYNKQKLNETI